MRSNRAGDRACARRALLLLLLLLLGGRAFGAELVVAAAVSLQAPLSEAARSFESRHPDTTIALTFGASNALAAQLRAGAPIDVLASAAESIIDALVASGALVADSRFTLARNRLVVVVPAGVSGPALRQPQDLLAFAKIAVPIAAVPLGGYARAWLRSRGLLDPLAERIVPTPHARATLAAVENHHADAAIVYASDARRARGARIALEIPDVEQPEIRYVAAAATSSRAPERAADLLAFLRSESGRQFFVDAGFALP